MLRSLTMLLAAFMIPTPARASAIDYEPLDHVLKRHVNSEGLVNYRALQQDRAELDRMVEQMERVSPASAPQLFPTRESQLAYWINAYNVMVLKMIVDDYPVRSIRQIGLLPYSAFFLKRVNLGGKKMTLRRLENDIIRKEFGDARIHFAINCASWSCPPLAQDAYRPETLDCQLDRAARAFINDNRHVTLYEPGQRIALSKIFDWYDDDFEQAYFQKFGRKETILDYLKMYLKFGRKETVLDYLKIYLEPERLRTLEKLSSAKVVYQDYDWSLNDQAQQR